MSLLIGIKQTHASGAYHGAEGFEGFSMDGTVVNILKEGSKKELTTFVQESRATAETAKKEIEKIGNKIDNSFGMTDNEYRRLEDEISKLQNKTGILRYDKLIIVEGIEI